MPGNENKAIVPIPMSRSMLYGAVVAGNLVGIAVTAMTGLLFQGELLGLYISIPLTAALIGAIVARARQSRSRSLKRIRQDLIEIQSMREGELIDHEEAQLLKSNVIAGHGKQPYDWRIPFWSGVFAMSVISVVASYMAALLGALAGAVIGAGGRSTWVLVQRVVRQMIGPEIQQDALPDRSQWEQLGTRK